MPKGPQGQTDTPDKPVRKRLNADQKRALKAAEIARFLKKSGTINRWPTDRMYVDHELRQKIRHISAQDLDELIREDEQ
jgi:hypothetical protein